jgi:hypothetical protein
MVCDDAAQNEKRTSMGAYSCCLLLVPRAGIEPARCLQRGILSPVRLPIPPSRQRIRDYRRFAAFEQQTEIRLRCHGGIERRIIAYFD